MYVRKRFGKRKGGAGGRVSGAKRQIKLALNSRGWGSAARLAYRKGLSKAVALKIAFIAGSKKGFISAKKRTSKRSYKRAY